MIWLLPVLLVIVIAAPFVMERRRREMDASARGMAPGKFAELSDGLTHYRWDGPADGPVLVCIHGLTTPGYVWDRLVPLLAEAGFRVLRYDLYGRGFSDRPRGAQTRAFFIRQLRELLQHQGVDRGITLFGYSMGGSIATVFAAAEPDRIDRLILLAPAGMIHVPGKLAELACRFPLLGDWLMLAFGGAQLRRGAHAQPGPPDVVAGIAARQDIETGFRGYLPAVLSSSRNMLAESLKEDHRALAAIGLPVVAIWGQDDSVIPITALGRLTEWNRNVSHATIAGAGHGLAFTHPVEVTDALGKALAD
ncbi:MAG: alpha/beta hydrolase [Rhodobacter sp.]|nr:alpha/beta hydrolase [Rhodobacter sp.]